MLGLGEIREREVGEREVEEKCPISLAWFEEKLEREKFKWWDPRVFYFSPNVRRKRSEVVIFCDFTFLPLFVFFMVIHLQCIISLS
jgi:hypothetical protein